MFCPKCSTTKTRGNSQYCTTCGLDLSGLDDLVESGGLAAASGRRQKGIRQGVMLMLVGVVLIPVWMFIGPMFPPDDRLVESAPSTTLLEQLFWLLMWVAFLAGAARIVYSFVFERTAPAKDGQTRQPQFAAIKDRQRLPSGDDFRPAEPGAWRSSQDLFEPVARRPRVSGDLG